MPNKSQEIRIDELPEPFFQKTMEEVANHVVGFLRIEDTPRGQDAVLIGSGTLVKVGQIHAILTADHVLNELPKKGRLGLLLSETLNRTTIDVQACSYLCIARGTIDSEGPDLGAVVITPSVASALAAKKVFYNLDLRREELLNNPPDLHNGVWLVNGFIAELTAEEPGQGGYSKIKRFYNFSGLGGPDNPAARVGDYDYVCSPVSVSVRDNAPRSFGGMSGGGFWQVPMRREADGSFVPTRTILSGVVFYPQRFRDLTR
ncbi:MAG: hypothetical protein A3G20_06605 [Acidobacteria bacterium RIFCSPLOWO2_12_FULL_59_11]|nr:MAG: hypothetical protein A3G20_06605 [Acidobacteria bacterium RIFCSPLOWO2_12_FULL_59_11]